MQSEYDVIIVVAGYGGSWTAEKSAKVLLLENDREAGVCLRYARVSARENLCMMLKSIEPVCNFGGGRSQCGKSRLIFISERD